MALRAACCCCTPLLGALGPFKAAEGIEGSIPSEGSLELVFIIDASRRSRVAQLRVPGDMQYPHIALLIYQRTADIQQFHLL